MCSMRPLQKFAFPSSMSARSGWVLRASRGWVWKVAVRRVPEGPGGSVFSSPFFPFFSPPPSSSSSSSFPLFFFPPSLAGQGSGRAESESESESEGVRGTRREFPGFTVSERASSGKIPELAVEVAPDFYPGRLLLNQSLPKRFLE